MQNKKDIRIYAFWKRATIRSVLILVVLWIPCLIFAQESRLETSVNQGYLAYRDIPETKEAVAQQASLPQKKEKLSLSQEQARGYRSEGLRLQSIGNLDAAMSLYQKALELDPAYAVVYNDLGIIYEIKGFFARAEESYLKSLSIAPNYLSAYSNLALFYENQRDLDRATFYWQKRAKLGLLDDPWTQKAIQRLKDIRSVQEPASFERETREQEMVGLMKDVLEQKSVVRSSQYDIKVLAQKYFDEAKRSYYEGNYATAVKQAVDAQQLDPANKEIEKFIEKAQIRALSR